jgi:uncharacterized cupredoxin-like copper-binding protein
VTRRPAILAAAGLIALAAAGCGEKREAGTGTSTSGGTSTTPAATGPAVATVKVSETEFKLDPASPEVPKDGVVQFDVKNDGATEHALEIETPDGEFETESIAPGKSATLKADLKAGTYVWYCPIGDHKDKGMEGEISVAGGGSGSPEDDKGGEDPPGGGGAGGY